MPKSPGKPFNWNRKGAELALALTFEGRWTQDEIARKCEVSPRTLWSWLKHPEFVAALDAKRADFATSIQHVAYADKARRIVALNQMAESARREYEARPWLQEIRPTPNGDVVNEAFNRDAHAAFREALNDIAKELGERASNVKVSGSMQYGLVPSGELAALADEMLDAVRMMPEARAALGMRLLASGE